MSEKKRGPSINPEHDPFRERGKRFVTEQHVLGGAFEFASNSRRLWHLVTAAYAGLPRHRLRRTSPGIALSLRLVPGGPFPDSREPPPLRMQGGAGMLCGVIDASNFAVLAPAERRGLVVMSPHMLQFPYHARYELLEFAVFVLAGRAQGLVPLHAACIGANGRGLLLVGASGAGKSTVALQCLLQGLEFLTEDAAFVLPENMRATGVANFLHLRADSLRFLHDPHHASLVRRSPVIRRRSGVEKFEIDIRRSGYRLAPQPLAVKGVVFLSKRRASGSTVLTSLSKADMLVRLDRSQRYAAIQPGWTAFRRRLSAMPAFELRRSKHPADAADALRRALE